MEEIKNIIPIIQQHQHFIITTHVNPDGDGLGSELALVQVLHSMGKQAVILNHSATPENYHWLDPLHRILQFRKDIDGKKILTAEAIFILDTNQSTRLRSLDHFVRKSKAVKIVIDHHLDPSPFANYYLIDDDATSTGEIVYRLIQQLNIPIDREIAKALYTAIMTDTGSFHYPRTDPEIHHIIAHLIECGADPSDTFNKVYENWSLGRMRLLGEVLDSMKTAYDGKLAYIVCKQKMFTKTNTMEVETDNFTTYPMSVSGVVIGILFNELNDGVKISFRSKENIPINELAKEFGGNGHLNAAGARIFNVNINDVIRDVIEKAGKYITIKK